MVRSFIKLESSIIADFGELKNNPGLSKSYNDIYNKILLKITCIYDLI
jgi:hypothetical protein